MNKEMGLYAIVRPKKPEYIQGIRTSYLMIS